MARNSVIVLVPSHSDILGNEIADRLSRMGARKNYIGPEPAIGASRVFLENQVREIINEKHRTYWRDSDGSRVAKRFLKSQSPELTNVLLNLNRKQLRVAVGIFTGHWLNAHLHRMGIVESPMCRWCSTKKETVEHVLCDCPHWAPVRLEIFKKRTQDIEDIDTANVEKLLQFCGRLMD